MGSFPFDVSGLVVNLRTFQQPSLEDKLLFFVLGNGVRFSFSMLAVYPVYKAIAPCLGSSHLLHECEYYNKYNTRKRERILRNRRIRKLTANFVS